MSVSNRRIHDFFSPYERISPPWTLYEYVRTAILTVTLLPIRFLYFFLAGAFLAFISSLAMIGLPPSRSAEAPHKDPFNLDDDPLFRPLTFWRKALISLVFPICRSILFISFGVFRIQRDSRPFSAAKPVTPASPAFVIVANHLGYIDILVLLCSFRASFVAKGDFESTPLVGTIARALQCMFVRKGQSLTSQLINRVRSTYQCHEKRQNCPSCLSCMSSLVIFPEGTTSNGTAMIPFRTGVFNAALPVKPVCIQFPHRRFNLSWESIRFREHAFRSMTQLWNEVRCTELPVYVPTKEEQLDARLYASNVQAEMALVLNQTIVPLNRKHKFLYHSYLIGKETNEDTILNKAAELSEQDEQLVYLSSKRIMDAV